MPSGVYTGSNYVPNPEQKEDYTNNRVMAYALNSGGEITIPSQGTTQINGVTYRWSFDLELKQGGFHNQSWLLDTEYLTVNPLYEFGLVTVDLVAEYLSEHKNLNEVFKAWNPNMATYNKFNEAFEDGKPAAGCALLSL